MDLRGFLAAVLLLAVSSVPAASGQAVATSCTAALVTSFAPCLGYVTNGTGGSLPTVACCRSLEAVVSTSTSCACLILTGSVPLGGLPVNRTLAVTLPKACNSISVPLQCKDTSPQLPAPGPVAVSPAMAPLRPMAPPPPPEPAAATPPSEPAAASTPPATSQPQARPQVVPSAARRRGGRAASVLPAIALLLAAVAVVV